MMHSTSHMHSGPFMISRDQLAQKQNYYILSWLCFTRDFELHDRLDLYM